jgi:hypothetical protein
MRLDDDTYLDTPHSIGEIKLIISRTSLPKKIRKKKGTINVVPPHREKIHERSKNGIAHRVKYVASLTLYNT